MGEFTDKDSEKLAYFFAFWWAVVCLNPTGQRSIINLMKQLELVAPKGKLALSSAGNRIMKEALSISRPKYPRKVHKRKRP